MASRHWRARLTDRQGQVVWQWAYSAFGDEKPTIAKYRFANLDLMPNPGTTGILPVEFNLGFPGMYRDKESGMSYNYLRTYDSKTDTYTQNDRIGLGGGWNRRIYAVANPLRFTDPFGLLNQEAQRQLNEWFGPKTPPGSCATAECAAGLLPAPLENRSTKDIENGQCRLVCGMTVGPVVGACLKAGGFTTLGSQLVGRWATTDACKLVCE